MWSWDHQLKYSAALKILRRHEEELMSGSCAISLAHTCWIQYNYFRNNLAVKICDLTDEEKDLSCSVMLYISVCVLSENFFLHFAAWLVCISYFQALYNRLVLCS